MSELGHETKHEVVCMTAEDASERVVSSSTGILQHAANNLER